MVGNQGTVKDFLWGLIFGVGIHNYSFSMNSLTHSLTHHLVFGFLALICIWERNITYRQKIGILVGVMINISVSVGTNNDANKS